MGASARWVGFPSYCTAHRARLLATLPTRCTLLPLSSQALGWKFRPGLLSSSGVLALSSRRCACDSAKASRYCPRARGAWLQGAGSVGVGGRRRRRRRAGWLAGRQADGGDGVDGLLTIGLALLHRRSEGDRRVCPACVPACVPAKRETIAMPRWEWATGVRGFGLGLAESLAHGS